MHAHPSPPGKLQAREVHAPLAVNNMRWLGADSDTARAATQQGPCITNSPAYFQTAAWCEPATHRHLPPGTRAIPVWPVPTIPPAAPHVHTSHRKDSPLHPHQQRNVPRPPAPGRYPVAPPHLHPGGPQLASVDQTP